MTSVGVWRTCWSLFRWTPGKNYYFKLLMKLLLVIKLQGNKILSQSEWSQLWNSWDINALPFIQMMMRTMARWDGFMLSAVTHLELLTPYFEPKEETGSYIIVNVKLNSSGSGEVLWMWWGTWKSASRGGKRWSSKCIVANVKWLCDVMIIWCGQEAWLHCGFFALFSQ